MYLTEEEARKKICPQPDMDLCRASGCMAWRWENEFIPRETRSDDAGGRERMDSNPIGAKPEGEGWEWDDEDCEWYRLHPERRKGFCGLAYKPE